MRRENDPPSTDPLDRAGMQFLTAQRPTRTLQRQHQVANGEIFDRCFSSRGGQSRAGDETR